VKSTGALTVGMALAFAAITHAVAADDDAAARQQLEQRLKLTASMMSDSGTAKRITSSGNQRAAALLDEGRVHHALAVELLAKGDLTGARRAADEALKHLGQARRLVPDAPARQNAAKQRSEQMLASLERLIDAWRQRIGPTDVEDGDLFAAIGLIATARGFAGEGRFEEAVWTLGAAEGHVLTGMNRVMHARTLDYTARASTPAEEFQLEMARHRSLTELVPLAVNDLKPRGDALALIDRYTEASSQLRQQAQAQFQAGDLPQALVHLRNALMYVQRALTSAGLVVPPSTGSTP
jgi:tetratricopeptide (TPR) repeat protein